MVGLAGERGHDGLPGKSGNFVNYVPGHKI